MATGLLPICLGEATKYSQDLLEADKTYIAKVKFGSRTDTGDAEGITIEELPLPVFTSEAEIRKVLESLDIELKEMRRCKSKGLCCGAGGAQMFKEEEKGDKRVNMERADEAIETKADFVASACPFCNTMMTDGIKNRDEEVKTEVLDIAEIIVKAIQ